MNENSNVVRLRHPDEIDDPLTNILRSGARQLLAQAIELEAEAFLAEMKGFRLADGRDRVVRHGHGPERTIQTGIGAIEVARVKIRDRGAASDGERIRFTSAILPLWARRTKSAGCASAGSLSAWHLDRRLPGGLGGAVGQGCAEPVAGGDFPSDGGVARRVRALAEAGFVGAPIPVCVGGRCIPAGSHGRSQRMHAGADRGYAGGQEGTDRFPGWRSGKRAELARTAHRCEKTGIEDHSGNRRW